MGSRMRRPTRFDLVFALMGVSVGMLLGIGLPALMYP
jgi:hypothetical protein